MKPSMLALVLAALLSPGAVLAAGEVNTKPLDPVLEKAQDATNHEDWAGAQAILKEALARTPNNPEYHNEYAYALRKGPKPDMSLVFQHYNEALRLDPKHRGANEYLGEAYLMIGNLPKAKEQLATLDKICFLPCKEYSELKTSIAAYEAKGK
jgi:cytochrome c-type biogenesis protein CcmH/NrfG